MVNAVVMRRNIALMSWLEAQMCIKTYCVPSHQMKMFTRWSPSSVIPSLLSIYGHICPLFSIHILNPYPLSSLSVSHTTFMGQVTVLLVSASLCVSTNIFYVLLLLLHCSIPFFTHWPGAKVLKILLQFTCVYLQLKSTFDRKKSLLFDWPHFVWESRGLRIFCKKSRNKC